MALEKSLNNLMNPTTERKAAKKNAAKTQEDLKRRIVQAKMATAGDVICTVPGHISQFVRIMDGANTTYLAIQQPYPAIRAAPHIVKVSMVAKDIIVEEATALNQRLILNQNQQGKKLRQILPCQAYHKQNFPFVVGVAHKAHFLFNAFSGEYIEQPLNANADGTTDRIVPYIGTVQETHV